MVKLFKRGTEEGEEGKGVRGGGTGERQGTVDKSRIFRPSHPVGTFCSPVRRDCLTMRSTFWHYTVRGKIGFTFQRMYDTKASITNRTSVIIALLVSPLEK